MNPRLIVLLIALGAVGLYANQRSWRAHAGALAPADRDALARCVPELLAKSAPALTENPVQTAAPSCAPFKLGDATIKPLSDFVLTARVLGSERYRFDSGARFAPIDLAVGWGPMAQSRVLDEIDISQNGRFFHWFTTRFPIPRAAIEAHASNLHIVPANAGALRALGQLDAGDGVRLWGFLVRIDGESGYQWQSSLSRTDTGSGACELIWVERIESFPIPRDP
jgi:hypothetical protein